MEKGGVDGGQRGGPETTGRTLNVIGQPTGGHHGDASSKHASAEKRRPPSKCLADNGDDWHADDRRAGKRSDRPTDCSPGSGPLEIVAGDRERESRHTGVRKRAEDTCYKEDGKDWCQSKRQQANGGCQ